MTNKVSLVFSNATVKQATIGGASASDVAASIAAAVGEDALSVVYVGKQGLDANDGLKIGESKLTIASAVTQAAALITSGAAKAVVRVMDSGTYTENVVLPDNVILRADASTLVGSLTLDPGAEAYLDRHFPASGSTVMVDALEASGDTSHYSARVMDGRGTGGALTNVDLFRNASSGRVLMVDVGVGFVPQGGIGLRDQSAGGFGHIHFNCKDIYLAGNNAQAIRTNNANTNIIGYVDHILEFGTPTGTVALDLRDAGSIVKITASEIIADSAWVITAGALYINCPKITGTQTGTATIVNGQTPDINAGLAAANAPTALNPFATMEDVGEALPQSITPWLLLDDFRVAEAAPINLMHACEPGPGSFTVVDSTPTYSISNGDLVVGTGNASAYTDPQIYSQLLTPVTGLAAILSMKFKNSTQSNGYAGLSTIISASPLDFAGFFLYYNAIQVRVGSTTIDDGRSYMPITSLFIDDVPIQGAIIARDAGAFFLTRGSGTNWRLAFIDEAIDNVTARVRLHGVVRSMKYDYVGLTQFAVPWTDRYGIATSRSAISTNGQVITGAADGWIEHTITAATGVTQELMIRRTDDNNCWIVRMDQTGSKIYLYEKVAGVETERGATGGVAQTWTNNTTYRVQVCLDAFAITVYVGRTKKIIYTVATYNNAVIGVKVSHAGVDLIVWPLEIALPSGGVLSDSFWLIGDSKSLGEHDDTSPYANGQNGFGLYLRRDTDLIEAQPRSGYASNTLADVLSTHLYPDMATMMYSPRYILINLGTNELLGLPSQATWEANAGTMLDAIHRKFPSATIYMMRPWRLGFDAAANTLAGYIANVVAARPAFAALGPDERVYLKGSDNGSTYTFDGVHPNHDGHMLTNDQWKTILGL